MDSPRMLGVPQDNPGVGRQNKVNASIPRRPKGFPLKSPFIGFSLSKFELCSVGPWGG